MRRLREVQECEVIGEFLRNEFYERQYHRDRQQFERFVLEPDFSSARENAIRRCLLFRRRGHMWRELPPDISWFEVALEPADLARVRVFPRAQWSRLSNGTYWISDIVNRIREGNHPRASRTAVTKVYQLRYRLQGGNDVPGSVLLIGKDERHAYTILEGNHRLAAAMLASPELARSRFRVFSGFSPRIEECCWYLTNSRNLWRYARHRLANLYDSEADIQRVLASVRSKPEAEQRLPQPAKLEVDSAEKTLP